MARVMGLSKRSSPPLAAPMTVIEIKPHRWGCNILEEMSSTVRMPYFIFKLDVVSCC
jgi:hypothetical protein